MKNNKLCKFSALVLAAAMVLAMIPVSALAGFSGWFSTWADAEEVSVETQATTVFQPFESGTGGSTYFRIPAIVTLDDGTIVAAADARWNATTDGGGLDTIVSYSKDNGETWNYSFANYLDDNGDTHNKASTTFIDPALATDGKTVYMLVDLYPSGYSNTTSATTYVTKTGDGFNSDETLKLCAASGSSYDYYLDLDGFDSDGYAYIYDSNGSPIDNYKVDQWFNLYKDSDLAGNLFYTSSAYHVYTTQYLYLTKSEDGGKTWSAPTLINVKENEECFYGVCPGSGCVTEDGTIIFTCYGCETIATDLRASYIYSTDNGKTWKRSWGRATTTFQNKSSEASITEVTVGSSTYLYMFTRYYGTPATKGAYYFSADGGKTWTAKTDISYTCGSDMGVITYSGLINDKPAMLLSAHSSSARNSGMIYTITVEENGDLTLVNTYSVNGSSYYAYSDLTELSDGSIGLLYESDSAEITFKKIDIRDIVGTSATITNPTVTDETSGISVSAPGLTKVEVSANNSIDKEIFTNAEDVVAYEITLNNGRYTKEATVTLPLPPEWKDCTDYENRIFGFVTDGDNKVEKADIPATVSGDTVTVTFPHFSTVGIFLAAEATSEGGSNDATVTEEKDVTLYVGEDTTITDETGNYKSTYTGAGLDTTIATVTVTGVEEVKPTPTYDKANSVKVRSLITADSGENEYTGTTYYYNNNDQYYPLYVRRETKQSSYFTYYYYYYYLDEYGVYHLINEGGQRSGQYTGTNDTVNITIYELSGSTGGTPAFTTITFHAVSAGHTSVIVGNTQYNITVNKKTEGITLSIGGTYTLDNAGKNITKQPDAAIATATIANDGTLTITGVAVGETTVETEKYIVKVTVTDVIDATIENSPFVGGTTNFYNYQNYTSATSSNIMASKGEKLTKLTISKGLTFDVDLNSAYGTDVTWEIKDTSVATVNDGGKVTAVKAGETYLIATVNGATYQIPVVVRDDGDGYTEESRGFHFYIDQLTDCELFYSAYCSDKLEKAVSGEVIYLITHDVVKAPNELCIDFFIKPEDGYVLTTIDTYTNKDGSTITAGNYSYIRDEDGNPDFSDSSAWWGGTNTTANGTTAARRRDCYGEDAARKMLIAATNLDCDATMGYSQSGTTTTPYSLSAKLSFRADRLPTVEKKVTKVNDQDYVEGMTAGVNDVVTFEITVHRYECANPIYYTNPVLTEADGFTFADSQKTQSLTELLKGAENTESAAESKTYAVSYTIKNSDLDTTITNVVAMSYSYVAAYGKGTRTSTVSAEASIVAPGLITNDIIVDFGLPVECDYSKAATYTGWTLKADSSSTNAKVANNVITYTPTKALLENGMDVVKFTNTKTNAATYTFKVIPASNVLYEENFLTKADGWTEVKATTSLGNQTAETVNTTDPTAYGYDDAYKNSTTANGVYQATGLTTQTMTAALTTTFTGTGFDLIGNCGPTTGLVMLVLQNQTTDKRYVSIVDTRYGTTDKDTLYQVPLAHKEVPRGTYKVEIYATGAKATTATTDTASAVSTYSVNRTSASETTAFERYLKENNITDVEYIVMSDVLNTSAQSVSAVSTYATTAATVTRLNGTHVEIDAFRVYYNTTADAGNPNTANYTEKEQNVQYVNILEAVGAEQVTWWVEGGTYTGEVSGYEGAGGAQKEIYLSNNQKAVIFDIDDVDEIQVSFRSVDGNAVTVTNATGVKELTSSTEMYYTLTKDENSAFTIVNTGSGILGIGNIKYRTDSGEVAILTASELDPEVISYSLRMALAVEPDQPVEDEPEQPVTFVPETFNVSTRSVNVLGRKLVTVSVTASTDVAYITVNGQKVSAWNNGLSWIYQPNTLRFTFTDLLKRGESKTYEIVAYNADGVVSAVYTVQG